ncbi:hypothetical protein CLV70_12590 [Pseudosporangium ferrugineum]|uniref:Uncharacterized protein n=2 Tax=Pseudosporangium ferrugineum TaxID=439699 RepID=A0A2T0RGE0_9ACTN|nr:hypothetical protein CLV70_12590 [Pseudosporangium ferrugineum]
MNSPRAVPRLTKGQRLAVLAVTSEACRWSYRAVGQRARAEAVSALRAVSVDPVVLGACLGNALIMLQHAGVPAARGLVDLYRAAGADEEVAAAIVVSQQRSSTGGPA